MAAVFLLAGCGNGVGDASDITEGKKENTGTAEAEHAEKTMGRYLEREITVPEEVKTMGSYPLPYLQKLDDGRIVLAEQVAGRYVSADMGESWEYLDCPWEDVGLEAYISDIAFSPDGGAAVIYSPFRENQDGETQVEKTTEETEKADTSGREASDGTETAEAKETENSEAADQKTAGSEESAVGHGSDETIWKTLYFDANGNRTELDFSETGDTAVQKTAFDRKGALYCYTLDGRVYRVDPAAGTKKELFTVEGIMDYVCFTDRYMVGFTSRSEVVIYDLESGALAQEDTVLQEFVDENLGGAIGTMDRGHFLIAAMGEQEDIIYFAFGKGLYRHVIGGTVIEQVIDGVTSSFGDPSMMLMDMVMLQEGEFLVLYDDVRLYQYTYDPNVPSVPERQLKVYSLVENYSMRQAVSLFQKMHQDVYVRYEIGMFGEDGLTREDAIRNLNTKIMSGEGPDILLLDGLPQASYEEKGILADMSSVVDGFDEEDELFPNVVEACRMDGKIYGLPIRIQVPMMAGSGKYVEKIEDICTLADAVEEMRAENPEGAILGLKSEEELLYVLSLTSSAAWTDEKGDIDERALEEFLAAAERIWQAEVSGVDVDWLKERENFSLGFSGDDGYYATLSINAINMAMGEQKFALGKVYRVDFDYSLLTGISELSGDDFDLWNGQVSGGFIPDGITGVSSAAAEDELALEFYKFLFGRELQDMDLAGGLPVNMASFDTFAENPRAGEISGDEELSGNLSVAGDEGDYFSLDVKWPDKEEFQKLKEITSSLSRISIGDGTIEQAVYEIGPDALNGNITPQEAVREIVKKSAIYLAE